LAAAGGSWLVRVVLAVLPIPLFTGIALHAAAFGGMITAVSYAALAGWGVSTQRAVLMLSVIMLVFILSRSLSPARVYFFALTLVLMLDPLAPLGAGFWFSFLAVAVLLSIFVPRQGSLVWWKAMLPAQAGIMLIMLPVGAYWFQFYSPVAFLANLIAIPWVSFTVVPLTLAGITLLWVSSTAAAVLLGLAGKSSLGLLRVLEFLSQQQGDPPHLGRPGLMTLLLATIGGFLLLLPAGLSIRWLGPFFLLPLMFPAGSRFSNHSLRVDVLDVGQGSAVLVNTPHHTLVYDSGPGNGLGLDLVNSVVMPALSDLGRSQPDRIIISHGDLDHAGGIHSLSIAYPEARWNINRPRPEPGEEACRTGLSWAWDGFEFRVLHPSKGLPYLGNDSSCVLSIRGANTSLLLAGDISTTVERRLVDSGLAEHQLLIVPHHGSSSSSSPGFIDAVQAEVAVATTGKGNRFGFPKEDVIHRYRDSGAQFWSSGNCGGLRIFISDNGSLAAESARRLRQKIWRWPATGNCP
jgi:competence protein ComEC